MPRAAQIRQCVILVGGRGTRLGEIAATVPKPMLHVAGRPFLAWLMRFYIRFGVTDFLLLTGHLSDEIEAGLDAIASALPKPVTITISREPTEGGTGGALHHAGGHLADRFLLCNGDSLFNCNLATLLAAAAHDDATTLGRVVLRSIPDASRFGVADLAGQRITAFSERPTPGTAGLINAGIYLFDRRILSQLSGNCSLERDILPGLASRGQLCGIVENGYFRDIGIPADLAAARADLPAAIIGKALFLDRDGVLNVDHGYVATRDRFEWMPGAREAVSAATAAGWQVFIVTNQSGVARGLYDEAAVIALHEWMRGEILQHGGTIDDIRYCPFHTEATVAAYRSDSPWRKPAPGMLLDLLRTWELNPAECVMIGDQQTDMEAAAAAKIPGYRFTGPNLANFLAPLLTAPPSK